MNFFTAQEQARTRTRWLILWFALAVLGTVACLYALVVFLTKWQLLGEWEQAGWEHAGWAGNPLAIFTAMSAMIIIPLGSAYKLLQLSHSGPSVVARDMGARPVSNATQEFAERQLLNVVEEMSIASGIPMPQVWVMDDEPSINAFAAGTEPSNAVVAVSRGCLEKLTRAELQGVVAHEFSHILNGDMRLNMRLIGWLFGLLMIAMLGRGVLSILRHTRGSSSDSKGSGGVVLVLLLVGASLWLIGSLGVFFGRIIQSAISRQREFLADASAVQFTRDPSGIAGALKKIARLPQQRVFAPKASEAAHLLFNGSVGFLFPGLLATHPPMIKRILAIEPNWDGDLRKAEEEGEVKIYPKRKKVSGQSAVAAFSPMGESDRIDVPAAAVLLESMQHQGSVGTVAQAKGLILALVSAGEGISFAHDDSRLSSEERCVWEYWHLQCQQMNSAQKIAWMDLAMPILRQMSLSDYQQFRQELRRWMERDQHTSVFEWMMHYAMDRHLHVCFERRDVTPIRWHQLSQVEEPLAQVLACLCTLSTDGQTATRCAEEYHRRSGRTLPSSTADFAALGASFAMLDAASPELKRQILELALWVIRSDQWIVDTEIEVLRALADAIGAVMPPGALPAADAVA